MKIECRRLSGDAGVVFERMGAAFAQAWTARPDQRWESFCGFAGGTARLRVVGQGLAGKMAQAFAHLLKGDVSAADLTIDLWDEHETAVAVPGDAQPVDERILNTTSYVEFGLILGALSDRYIGTQRPQVIAWFDRLNQHIVAWVKRHDQLSLYDCGKPLHLPLLLWHSDHSAEVIHGALVSKNGQGVLLAGKGGVGKSTVALACLEAGFEYFGDDYIALEGDEQGAFFGHSLYGATWLMADHLTRFPRLISNAIYPERPDLEKTLVLLSQIFPRQISSRAPIRALVLPRLTGRHSLAMRTASRAEALLALAPSSILLRPRGSAATLEKLARLVDRVPSYWLELGQDLNEIPQRVNNLIESSRPD